MAINNDRPILVVEEEFGVSTVVPVLEQGGYALETVNVAQLEHACLAPKRQKYDVPRYDIVIFHIDKLSSLGRALTAKVRAWASSSRFILLVHQIDDSSLKQYQQDLDVEVVAMPVSAAHLIYMAVERARHLSELGSNIERYETQLDTADKQLNKHIIALERDQRAAKQIQTNLLPMTPLQLGSVLASYQLIPSLYLSGDFIDYGLIRGNFIPFYLADVSGHGASSAFVTVWLKQLVRRYFEDQAIFRRSQTIMCDLSNLIKDINQQMMRSRFFCHLTCCLGAVDLRTNTLHYIVAGHLPLPILMTSQKAHFLSGRGKPVGIFDEAQWEVHSVDLPEAYSVHIFSDGILEVLPEAELLSKEEHLLSLVETTDGDFQAMKSQLDLDEMDTMPDDISMLTLLCKSGSQHQHLASNKVPFRQTGVSKR